MRLGSAGLGGESAILRHPYFRELDWDLLNQRQMEPPFRPRIVCGKEASREGSCPSSSCPNSPSPPTSVLCKQVYSCEIREEMRSLLLACLLVGHMMLCWSLFPSTLGYQRSLSQKMQVCKTNCSRLGITTLHLTPGIKQVSNPQPNHFTCCFPAELSVFSLSTQHQQSVSCLGHCQQCGSNGRHAAEGTVLPLF